jgi:hypothetical protein
MRSFGLLRFPRVIRSLALASVASLASLGIDARAQAPAAASSATTAAPLTATVRRAVVDTLATRLRRHYVDADTGAMIADRLQKQLASGAYDAITSPARLAEALTVDLRSVNGDRHLNVSYNPNAPGLRPGPEGIRMFGPPPGGAPAGPRPNTQAQLAARRVNFTLGRVEVLPGNVGYFDIRGFSGAPDVAEAIKSALEYLQYTDAIIFDLRRNGGGSPFSVNMIISHFTTADTLPSLTVKNRSGNETFTRYTLPSVPGPRRPTVPLYVLTSGATASAGEDFTFVLKNMHRATIVGGTTAGAGHNNANLDIGQGFNASISFTRVMAPTTGAEWERVGVVPDVKVDPAHALEVAHALALKTIIANEPDERRRHALDLTREALEAQASPHTVPVAKLQGYVGEYEGGRTVALEDGRLTYSGRVGLPTDPLVPLNDSTFAFGVVRLSFDRDASGKTRLRLTPPEGEALTYNRVK